MGDRANIDLSLEDAQGDEEQELSPESYEITSAPNDFNLATMYDFIKSGVVKIPGFQRNYVWDLRRASKLIESLLLKLPIPQIFLYETDRNSFLVVDGQQRLMTVYYFREGRFPRDDRRVELRKIFDQRGKIPDEVLRDPLYFAPFALKLRDRSSGANPLNGLTYETLGERRAAFDITTIRNVIIRQLSPKDDMSSVYEIFSRLNTEGVNLERQELRTSLYHSAFYDMLGRANDHAGWRRLFGSAAPELHMRDIQHLLRAVAVLCMPYTPSMVSFLDRFSEEAKKFTTQTIVYLESLFVSFMAACDRLPDDAFSGGGGKFSIMVFEAVFCAVCERPYSTATIVTGHLELGQIQALKRDQQFSNAAIRGTTSSANVESRLAAARRIIQVAQPV